MKFRLFTRHRRQKQAAMAFYLSWFLVSMVLFEVMAESDVSRQGTNCYERVERCSLLDQDAMRCPTKCRCAGYTSGRCLETTSNCKLPTGRNNMRCKCFGTRRKPRPPEQCQPTRSNSWNWIFFPF